MSSSAATNTCPSQLCSEYPANDCKMRGEWKKQACDLQVCQLQKLWFPPVGLSVQATSGLTEGGLDLRVLA